MMVKCLAALLAGPEEDILVNSINNLFLFSLS